MYRGSLYIRLAFSCPGVQPERARRSGIRDVAPGVERRGATLKSYACLLVACSPLLYFIVKETKSLGEDTLTNIHIHGEAKEGKDQLAKAKAEVVKFEQIDKGVPGLPAGALGIAPLPPDLDASGAGLQRALSEKFGPTPRPRKPSGNS